MKYVKLFFSYRARQFEKHDFEKNAFNVFSFKTWGRTWRDKKILDFQNFSNSGLKFYMRISECIYNRIMMKKKYRFFYPFTGEAPLKSWQFSCELTPNLRFYEILNFLKNVCGSSNFRQIWTIVLKMHTLIKDHNTSIKDIGIEFDKNRFKRSRFLRFWIFKNFFLKCVTCANFELLSSIFMHECTNT